MKASELEAIGFVEAGACVLDSGLKSGVRFALSTHKKDRVLYAFVVQHEVMYIGSCDNARTCFASRMARYQGIMGAGTNKRVVGFLREVLSKGHLVRILVWRPEADFHVQGMPVDLIKGLENPLIQLAKPEWNIQSKPPAAGMTLPT